MQLWLIPPSPPPQTHTHTTTPLLTTSTNATVAIILRRKTDSSLITQGLRCMRSNCSCLRSHYGALTDVQQPKVCYWYFWRSFADQTITLPNGRSLSILHRFPVATMVLCHVIYWEKPTQFHVGWMGWGGMKWILQCSKCSSSNCMESIPSRSDFIAISSSVC